MYDIPSCLYNTFTRLFGLRLRFPAYNPRPRRECLADEKVLCALASLPLRRLAPLANDQLNLQYSFDFGADRDPASVSVSVSVSPTPAPRQAPLRSKSNSTQEQGADCGICFENAVSPGRTSCWDVFCTEHIAAWLHGPASDGRCPACRARVRASPATALPSESPSLPDSNSSSKASPPSPGSSLCSGSHLLDAEHLISLKKRVSAGKDTAGVMRFFWEGCIW
ncbi:hypothetical protein B0H13DRAFT_1885068 [Mycena leptocephala]|nr:hypothetical protein B0H13DRAFT_1885068 [Mycena leptocephala]